jgi:photosystem II stability/assembly factor-like uncharacterized protein
MSCRFGFHALAISMAASAVMWAAPPTVKPWVPFGPDGGDARRIVPDPRDHAHLYLGTANGWIYQSHNAGGSWIRLAQLGKRDDLVLDSIVVDARNPRHLIVGVHSIGDRPDGGIFYSWDDGASWTEQAEMRGQSVLSMAASVSDPKLLVAGTLRGVYRSTDGGQRWAQISPPDSKEIHNVQSVAIDPADPNIIYAGTWHLPWKTTDGGENWAHINKGIIDDSDVFSIIVDPEKPQTVFASACSGIYKSEDAGVLFSKIKGIPNSARRTRRLLEDPHHLNVVFAGTTEGLFRSEDAGKTWIRTTGPEIIVNDVEVDLADSRHVLIATDRGGVLASDDGGDSFHPSNGGFSARQVTALKRDARHPETLFAGVVNDKDWGGVFESDNGGQSWAQRSVGLEGRDVFALGQAHDGTMIAGTSHGLFRLNAADEVWQRVDSAPGTPARRESVQAILTRPEVETASGDAAPATSPDGAENAEAKTNAAPAPAKKSAAHRKATGKASRTSPRVVAKKTPTLVPSPGRVFDGAVYALATAGDTMIATTSVGLLTSVDNGASWAATGPEGSNEWRYLAAAKKHAVAASLRAVAVSSDSGVIWESVKLPAQLTQIASVAVTPSGELWVGGREGVFVSPDDGKTWSVPKNLYLNSVNNIFYDDAANRLMITTSGNSSLVFTVRLEDKWVSFTDTGWNLRFARSMGDHIVAVTLFDGIVVQPRMVDSPVAPAKASVQAKPTAEVAQQVKQP